MLVLLKINILLNKNNLQQDKIEIMKKISLFFVFGLFLFSCSEEEILPTVEDVIGNWQVTNLEYSGNSTTTFLDQSFTVPFNGVGQNMDMSLIFNESPQNFTTNGTYDIELSYDLQGQPVTQQIQGLPFLVPSGEWALEGNEITLTSGSLEPQIAKIISFDKEKLVMQATQITTTSEMGVEAIYDIVLTFTMQRQ